MNVNSEKSSQAISVNQAEFLEQEKLIEKLTAQVKSLEGERDTLKVEVEILKNENSNLKTIIHSANLQEKDHGNQRKQSWKLRLSKRSSSPSHEDVTATSSDPGVYPAQSTPIQTPSKVTPIPVSCLDCEQETVLQQETRCDPASPNASKSNNEDNAPDISVIKYQSKKPLQRTPRHTPRRNDSSVHYELSSDLREKNLQCLEKKYGGKENANQAALLIQQCYRHWALNKSFKRMRASSGRKRSITLPEKHFGKLNKTSLVFYGPENPVMIIDDENRFHMDSTKSKHSKFIPCSSSGSEVRLESLNETVEEADLLVDDLKKDIGIKTENHTSKEEKILVGTTKSANIQEVPDGVLDDVVFVEDIDVKESRWHNSSDDSTSQYDIIDDSQVLTVLGKEVDTTSGSRISVHTIHDDTPNAWILDDTSQQYEPTFDKSMHKRQFRIGVNLFNWKPAVGIDYLVDNEHIQEDVKIIAEFLRTTTTISKQKISEYFSNLRDEFVQKILLEFAKSFEFAGKPVDEALRQFQSYFKLTGEAQTVEKFLQVFSDRYVECNPDGLSNNPDNILLLAFALAMLNTDLHNQNVKRRMTSEEFLKNLRGTNDGIDFDQQMLTDMYTRIQKNEFATGADHTTQLHQIENSFIGKKPNLADTHRQFVKLFTLEEVVDPNRKDKPHARLAFLFNDLLILAKPRGKGGMHGSGHLFSCKGSFPLLGKKVAEFNNEHYPFGVILLQKLDDKGIATFHLKDEETRKSFVDELDEYIRETNGMENIRIALSKTNQLAIQNRRKDPGRCKSLFLSKNSITSQDSGFHGMDKAETVSLMDLRIGNSLEAEDVPAISNNNTIVASSSMNDINKDGTDGNFELVRTSSSSSLDPAVLSDSNITSHDKDAVIQPSSATLPRQSSGRKSLFAQIRWRKVNSNSITNTSVEKKLISTSLQQERTILIPSSLSPPLPP